MNARRGKWLVAAGVVVSVAAWWTRVQPASVHELVSEPAHDVPVRDEVVAPTRTARAPRARRLVTSIAFACLFFAGAAFTAGAGNIVAHTDEPAALETGAVTTTAADPAPAEETTAPAAEPAPAPAADAAPPAETTAAAADTASAADDVAVATAPARTGYTAPAPATATATATAAPAVAPATRAAVPAPKRHEAVEMATPMRVAHISFVPAAPFDLASWENANPASPVGATAVAIARHFVGTPYVWGGASPSGGFDCSGLMQYVYGQLGISLPHYAAAQFAVFPRLSASQLRPGDLVFFEPKIDGPGHVAMYMGGDAIVEAPHTGALVRVGSLSRSAAALGFMGAVRPYTATSALRLTAIHRSARTPASGPGTADLVFAV